jgi:hypothetical protein
MRVRKARRSLKTFNVTENRLRLIIIIAALLIAALAIGLKVELPAVWTFLTVVVTAALGRATTS